MPNPPSSCDAEDRKSTRLNSSHVEISYAVFCLQIMNRSAHLQCTLLHLTIRCGRFGDSSLVFLYILFFNDTATTEIYTLSLHDALPIWRLLVIRLRTSYGLVMPVRPSARP